MLLYIAGKVSKDSQFGTHHWRDAFVAQLAELSSLKLSHLDPLAYESDRTYEPEFIFNKDCWLIDQVDCVVVYLSDDISVGGSQEMLIAKYLRKPLIGFAPLGGKFNQTEKEFLGRTITDYVDPFVHASCDVVASTIEDVARALCNLPPQPKNISLIDRAIERAQAVLG
ncbi:MAG TPA: hypothetical protein VF597_00855 [Candidatus Saccharimonadales bacterium]|jgi:hypothetical protein